MSSPSWTALAWFASVVLATAIVTLVSRLRARAPEGAASSAETADRDARQRLAVAAQAARIGDWWYDPERDTVWLSPAARHLFRASSEELELEAFLDRLDPHDRGPTRATLRGSIATSVALDRELRVRHEDGGTRWVLVRGRSALSSQPPGVVRGVAIDVTAVRLRQLDSQRDHDALAHAERLALMGELAASTAHELNQPLAAILSNAQAARELLGTAPSDLAELEEILEDIEKDDERAVGILRRMYRLGRKAEGDLEFLDARDLVRDVIDALRNDAQLRGVRILVQLDERRSPIHGDRVQLHQVLLNLVLNAFDAMESAEAGARDVWVRSRRAGGSVIVTVSDRGIGIPVDRLEKVFEAFFTTKKHGLGLGLALSRSIVEAHGGRLWAERHPERGATFGFDLPISEPAAVAAEAPLS